MLILKYYLGSAVVYRSHPPTASLIAVIVTRGATDLLFSETLLRRNCLNMIESGLSIYQIIPLFTSYVSIKSVFTNQVRAIGLSTRGKTVTIT